MKDIINMILCWCILPTIILLAMVIKPLGLLLGYLFLGVIILYSIYAIGIMLIALGALLISPFISDNN